MAAGHDAHLLHRPGDSPVHRLAPEAKLVAAVGFTIAVVSTPREAFWAFGVYAVLIAAVAAVARIPAGWLARRATIELPFVALALALPLLAGGERVEVAGRSLSVDGLLGGWNILAKATLGLLASLLLIGTTTVRDLIVGLERLRCPTAITQIITFMLRYLDVLVGEARRMRVARLARGDDPRFLWQLRGFATALGALFLRAYERGERVWLAMRSRGWRGRLPETWQAARAATAGQWSAAISLPAVAALVAITAGVIG
ncbi:MAG TPA: cobalt ECF transporter T component CbiQ [Natronosporangium sp.]